MNKNEVAKGVRVKLNPMFEAQSLGEENLLLEKVIFISDEHVYNDAAGDYVFVKGGSLTSLGAVHLTKLDAEFPMPVKPLIGCQFSSEMNERIASVISDKLANPIGSTDNWLSLLKKRLAALGITDEKIDECLSYMKITVEASKQAVDDFRKQKIQF